MNKNPHAEALALGKLLFNKNKVWRRKDTESIY
jgi:hypothetical protein